MFYLETDKKTYLRIRNLLPDIKPSINMTLVSCDDNLELLGFCESAPCTVSFDLSRDELDDLLDDLTALEINAYSSEGGELAPKSHPARQKYEKYGWLYDVLFYIEEHRATP